MRHRVWEWEQYPHGNQEAHSWLQVCNRLLLRSKRWPFAAFLLMWPLLGFLIALLLLAGQSPDAVIKAFTETAQWNLSQRVAPQNIYYDEHYLCTVAAGGHKKIVKPLEWFFLLVLYLVDVNPENRIALQYTGKSLWDFPDAADSEPVTKKVPAPDADKRIPSPPGPGGCG